MSGSSVRCGMCFINVCLLMRSHADHFQTLSLIQEADEDKPRSLTELSCSHA